jgi:UDP-GlcNAc3NAcA epimerase
MKKILTTIGARPQFIKAAPISQAITNHTNLQEIIVHTGQHYDHQMSAAFFTELNIPQPKYNLAVGSARHIVQMANIMTALDEIIQIEQPDLMIVYGDTNSTAAAAIVSAKNNIPLAHIEAGLREFNKQAPEEINKLITDSVSDLYFCPTPTAVKNLNNQGIHQNIHLTGDISLDLLAKTSPPSLPKTIRTTTPNGETTQIIPSQYYLVTCHRAANTDNPQNLENILTALTQLKHPVIFPLHPRTKQKIQDHNLSHLLKHPNILTTQPQSFWETQTLLKNAQAVLTDSGGLIKEAYFHSTPCITLDTQTEWIETIQEGWNQISGPNKQNILQIVKTLTTPNHNKQSLGNGTAAVQIIQAISNYLFHSTLPD